MQELTESIKIHGVLQPLLVRRKGLGYQLVAGERRLRAAKLAGLEKVPVVIKELDDRAVMEIALVENLQREDLNPIEEAQAYRRLTDSTFLGKIAKRLVRVVLQSPPCVCCTFRAGSTNVINEQLSRGTPELCQRKSRATAVYLEKLLVSLPVRETEEIVRLTHASLVSETTEKRKKKPTDGQT